MQAPKRLSKIRTHELRPFMETLKSGLLSGAQTNMGFSMELSKSSKLHISFGPPCKTEFSIYGF
ncbi:MAG: hypothetical protein ACFFE4_09690 [Candidatus Thorarchaeota archaeon]